MDLFDIIGEDLKENMPPSLRKEAKPKEERMEERASSVVKATSGFAAADAAQKATKQVLEKYAKPDTYTGNRNMLDSPQAKKAAKMELFKSGKTVRDPYTGKELVLTKKEAKLLYGEDWQNHQAETDHIKPLKQIFEENKGNRWNTMDDMKSAANSKENLSVASRKYNNPKRDRSNTDYVEDEEYWKSKGVELTEKGKQQAIKDQEIAETSIKSDLRKDAVKHVAETGHRAGMMGAKNAGISALTTSGIMNLVAVIKGEKSGEEALEDTVKVGGKAAVTGYATTGALTVVSNSIAGSSSRFIQGLIHSNVPGRVITAVTITGDTLKRWGNGEITTQECLIDLGEKGLNMATMGYAMAAGQAMIPIPVVGGAIGALVGSMLTSTYYNNLITSLQEKELEHQERLRIIEECQEAARQTKAFRAELEEYLTSYFKEYRECFDMALSSMRFAWEAGDAEGLVAGANDITRKLGGQVKYDTFEEFQLYLESEETDVF